jgi:16S rRNA (guanine966-N2)-methyltransferase
MTRSKAPKSTPSLNAATGELRIIGGQWRSRKLRFPTLPGLRPTPDRVRETLFNWLAPIISGARCLDLFAGSGALGLEALSRGAANCFFIDNARSAADALRDNLQLLKSTDGSVVQADGIHWLHNAPTSDTFHIVFLDPPFAADLLASCFDALIASKRLAAHCWIYIETARDTALPPLPLGWQIHREKVAGQVCYRLIKT